MRASYSVTHISWRSLPRDFSITAVVAGLTAALVSYAGPFAVVLQATRAAHLDAAHTASWVWAVAIGSGVSGLLLTALTRTPIVVAWSTPGAALLIASIGGFRFSDAVGAFLLANLAAVVLGFTGLFGRLLALLPGPLLSALLAGILLPFVTAGGLAVAQAPVTAGVVVLVFMLGKRFVDRYAVMLALAAGIIAVLATGSGHPIALHLELTSPLLTVPTFEPRALLTIALPLLLVTMAGQNAPGLTVLRNSGYAPSDRFLVGGVSTISTLLTPLGGHATNLAAITAAICTSSTAHPDPRRRYVAGLVCGLANLAAGLTATWLVDAYLALPAAMIAALAAIALLPALIGALTASLAGTPAVSTAAVATLAVTASPLTIDGIGSAFWGFAAGVVIWLVLRPRDPNAATASRSATSPSESRVGNRA